MNYIEPLFGVYDDIPVEEVWGTYHYIANDIYRRLMAFRKLKKQGLPPIFTNEIEWNETIDKMIIAFTILCRPCSVDAKERQTVDDGLQLFVKYFEYLRD